MCCAILRSLISDGRCQLKCLIVVLGLLFVLNDFFCDELNLSSEVERGERLLSGRTGRDGVHFATEEANQKSD